MIENSGQKVTLIVNYMTHRRASFYHTFKLTIRAAVLLCCVATSCGAGELYGLSTRDPIAPYLNGGMPAQPPQPGGGGWQAVVAFPNLTFLNAVGLTFAPATSRLYVWEREGRIWAFENIPSIDQKKLVVDLSTQCQGWDDSGLLGVAFHPNFVSNKHMYVWYAYTTPGAVLGNMNQRPPTQTPNRNRLSRFTLDADGIAIPGSELVVIDQLANAVWHKGGGMFFHPDDGFLYITVGDDTVINNAQTITQSLFGGVLRIDVDRRGGVISKAPTREPLNAQTLSLPGAPHYFIPLDNPFVGRPGACEELFAIGLRSPHRMTCDKNPGNGNVRIFIGDVGAGAREEVSIIEPGDPKGLNFQWPYREGNTVTGTAPNPLIGTEKPPVISYPHGGDGFAVIGGYVYRGAEHAAALGGKYIFGDNGSGIIWYLNEAVVPNTKVQLCVLPDGTGPNSGNDYVGLSSFGLDQNNELYICQMSSIGGRIYKLARTDPQVGTPIPPLLSQTGAFQNVPAMQSSTGLIAYGVNSPLYSDNAFKQRWIAVPNDGAPYDSTEQIGFSEQSEWTFPSGTVFVKHFELDIDETIPGLRKRLETRLLVRDSNASPQNSVYGVTYKWRKDNSEADLLSESQNEDLTIKLATPVGAFSGQDINGALPPGSLTALANGYRIIAGGSGTNSTSDQFHFAHQQRSGDFDVKVRVASLTRADLYTKAGLMARESLTAGSRHLFFFAYPANEARTNNTGGYGFQYRAQTGGASAPIYPPIPNPVVNYAGNETWLRLRRDGDLFDAYTSTDGVSWRLYASQSMTLPATLYFGMAATSNVQNVSTTAQFADFANNRAQSWYYPGRSDCLFCHNQNAKFVLGVKTRQLNGDYTYLSSGVTDNQLRSWNNIQMLSPAIVESSISTYPKLVPLTQSTASAEDRARSYIDSNCSHCHRPGGVQAFFDGRWSTPLASQNIVNGNVGNNLGIDNACVIMPKDQYRSILYVRDNSLDSTIKMPPLAKHTLDEPAMAVMREWINSLPGTPTQQAPDISPSPFTTYLNPVDVLITHPDSAVVLRYTTDGTLPVSTSTPYSAPIPLTAGATIRATAFKSGFTDSVAATATYTVVQLRTPENPSDVVPGLRYTYYEGDWNALPNFNALVPVASGAIANFDITPRLRNDYFGFRFTGFIEASQDGLYTFSLGSDDGSRLFIGSTLVVDNDGVHTLQTASGSIGLQAGRHAITVLMFDKVTGQSLAVRYAGPGIVGSPVIPGGALFARASDTVVQFSTTSLSRSEGSGSAVIGVTLNALTHRTVTVDVAIAGGSATPGSDFTLQTTQLTFNPGTLTQNVTVNLLNDTIDEPAETVQIELRNPVNAVLGASTVHTLTIDDDDNPPSVAFAQSSSQVNEGAGSLTITVALSHPSAFPISVAYGITGGSADAADCTVTGQTLNFSPGQVQRTISVSLNDDNISELDETLQLSLSNPSQAVLGANAQYTLTIQDNDGPPFISFAAAASSGAELFSNVELQVVLSNPSSQTVRCNYTLSGGSAGAQDFSFTPGTLLFSPGVTTAIVPVSITTDDIPEPQETIKISISAPVAAVLGSITTHTYTILDDDSEPTATFATLSSKALENSGSVIIRILLDHPSAYPVSVSIAVEGSATSQDFQLDATAVSFVPGETSQELRVTLLDDARHEADKTVLLQLTRSVNAAIGIASVHTLTIQDDDPLPSVSFSPEKSSGTEAGGNIQAVIKLSAPSDLSVDVAYAVTGGTAAPGDDFQFLPGSIRFLPGETSKQLTIFIVADTLDEEDETIEISLNTLVNATAGNVTLLHTIVDSNVPRIESSITPSVSSAIAGQAVQFTAGASSSVALTWQWDFGDSNIVQGSSALHAFWVPGIYTVTVTATNAKGESDTATLQFSVVAGQTLADHDNDGISDDMDADDDNDGISDMDETTAGSDPLDSTSLPKLALTIKTLKGRVRFNIGNRDSASVSGAIPNLPALFDPAGKRIRIDIGGAVAEFLLSVKGKGKSEQGSVALRLQPSKRNKLTRKKEFSGGEVGFKISLKNGAFGAAWLNDGFDPALDAAKQPLQISVDLNFNSNRYASMENIRYSARAKKSGNFKRR